MSTPQDSRAPIRQQRRIEGKNVGATDIPAYGYLEVVDSEHTTDGRTILHVQRPTVASPEIDAFCCETPIPAGLTGAVTQDFPHYVLYDGTTPVNGDALIGMVGAFTVELGEGRLIAIGDATGGKIRVQRRFTAAPTIRFRNDSGETAPAYGVMRVTDYDETTGVYVIEKPSSSVPFERDYLVNLGEDVADGEIGNGTWLEESGYVLTDGAAAPGEQWGAADDSWELVKNRYGFEIVGGDITEASQHRVVARQFIVVAVIGKADSAIAKDSTGTVTVWVKDAATGAWEASEFTIDDVLAIGSACAEDIYLAVEWKAGEWVCGPMECEEEDAETAALAGLTSAANKGIYFTGVGTAATYDLTSFGRTLGGAADASAARTSLGVVIGTDVQAYDADLASWAAITRAAGLDTFVATPSSANLKSLVTDETGSGALVFATSPTLVTPVLGVASATSINKVALTAPATGSTITIADGKTLTASNTVTLTATDGSTLGIGSGASLTAVGSLTPAADRLAYFTGTTTASLATLTSFARTLLDDVDADAVRTTLGVGTGDSPVFTTLRSYSVDPGFLFYETDGPTDGKYFRLVCGGGALDFQTLNDAFTLTSDLFKVSRQSSSHLIDTVKTDGRIRIVKTTEQLRTEYDSSNYTTWTVGSTGVLTVTPISGTATVGRMVISKSVGQDDAYGMMRVETTATSTANAGYTALNYYGTSQLMQWENYGIRFGSRIVTNSGGGRLFFTAGNDSVAAEMGTRGMQSINPHYALTDGTTIAVDWKNGPSQAVTIQSTGRTLTIANMPDGGEIELWITQGTGGSKTITTWFVTKWSGNTYPGLSTTAGRVDMFLIKRRGSDYWGVRLMTNM